MGHKCWICGAEVIWGSDFDSEDVGYDRPGLIHYFHCPNYGSEYEVFEPFEEEDEDE